MSELAPETIVSTAQGVMPGVEPATPRTHNVVPAAPQRVNQPDTSHDQVFTKEDIERARQQEKDKVYGKVDELTQRLQTFEAEREARLAEEAERQRLIDEAERTRTESETDLRTLLTQKEAEWEQRLAAEREERERAFALLNKEREFGALMEYKAQQVRAAEDHILPELLDEISGSTPDEIDASIARLVGKSESILNNVGAAVTSQRQAQPSARVTMPPVGPLETETGQQQFSAADIDAWDMAEFAKHRGSLGVTGGRTHRGLFG